jgi:hypothetical protein
VASPSSPKKPGRPAGKAKAKSRRAPPALPASDARAEHLLIAARRLGRERAGIVAGVISAERERVEREKERIEREKRSDETSTWMRPISELCCFLVYSYSNVVLTLHCTYSFNKPAVD